MLTAILLALLSLPRHFSDADEPDIMRRARLEQIATAIDRAANGDRHMAAVLASQAWSESRLASYTFEPGRCVEGLRWGAACDWDRRRHEARARTYFQVHRVACRAAWNAPEGSQASLDAAARCIASHWRLGAARCKTLEGGFAALSGGFACTRPTTPRRIATMRIVLAQLNAAPST